MCNAAGQLTDSFHLLKLADLGLSFPAMLALFQQLSIYGLQRPESPASVANRRDAQQQYEKA